MKFVASFLFSLLVIQIPEPPPGHGAPIDDPEAYVVYSQLIQQDWLVSVAKAKRLIIMANTVAVRHCAECIHPSGDSAAALQPLLNQLAARSDTPWTLQPNFAIDRPYDLVPEDKITSFFSSWEAGTWRAFANAFPDSGGGYIQLSPVIFSNDKTIAVVYESHHCGSLCGGGRVNILEKKNNVWSQMPRKYSSCSWVS